MNIKMRRRCKKNDKSDNQAPDPILLKPIRDNLKQGINRTNQYAIKIARPNVLPAKHPQIIKKSML
ncbi:hypothetical protein D3C74_434100 [compost metagenome]